MVELPGGTYLGRAGRFMIDALPSLPDTINPFAGDQEEDWEEIFALWSAEWTELPQQALELIGENAPEIHAKLSEQTPQGAGDPEAAAELWRRVFDQAGLKTDLISGLYKPSEDSEVAAAEHTWLKVEGALVDPTAGKYGDNTASFDYYEDTTVEATGTA